MSQGVPALKCLSLAKRCRCSLPQCPLMSVISSPRLGNSAPSVGSHLLSKGPIKIQANLHTGILAWRQSQSMFLFPPGSTTPFQQGSLTSPGACRNLSIEALLLDHMQFLPDWAFYHCLGVPWEHTYQTPYSSELSWELLSSGASHCWKHPSAEPW